MRKPALDALYERYHVRISKPYSDTAHRSVKPRRTRPVILSSARCEGLEERRLLATSPDGFIPQLLQEAYGVNLISFG